MKPTNILFLASAVIAAAIPDVSPPVTSSKKVIVYYNTKYQDYNIQPYHDYISPVSLAGKATHVILSTFHLTPQHHGGKSIDLSSDALNDPYFDPVWADMKTLQSKGVKSMAMIAGWTDDTWNNLASDFEKHYKPLHDMLKDKKLDGIDLDLEKDKNFTLNHMVKFINRLKTDFGNDFIVSVAPIPAAATNDTTLSGPFTYVDLHKAVGDKIDFYNYRFYAVGGGLTVDGYVNVYNAMVDAGAPGEKVVMGVTSIPGTDGYQDLDTVLNTIVPEVRKRTGEKMGGMMAWEFAGSAPDAAHPEKWAEAVKEALEKPLV